MKASQICSLPGVIEYSIEYKKSYQSNFTLVLWNMPYLIVASHTPVGLNSEFIHLSFKKQIRKWMCIDCGHCYGPIWHVQTHDILPHLQIGINLVETSGLSSWKLPHCNFYVQDNEFTMLHEPTTFLHCLTNKQMRFSPHRTVSSVQGLHIGFDNSICCRDKTCLFVGQVNGA
jgi:hypothetical protein